MNAARACHLMRPVKYYKACLAAGPISESGKRSKALVRLWHIFNMGGGTPRAAAS